MTAKKEKEPKQKMRIKVQAYDHKLIDQSVRQIIDAIGAYQVEVYGPIPLPTEIHKYSVKKSTFVHEDSSEQYEVRVHKRLIDIVEPDSKVIDALMSLNLPAGVDIEIKTV